MNGRAQVKAGAPCKQHACFFELCLTSMMEAHDGLGAIMEFHE